MSEVKSAAHSFVPAKLVVVVGAAARRIEILDAEIAGFVEFDSALFVILEKIVKFQAARSVYDIKGCQLYKPLRLFR